MNGLKAPDVSAGAPEAGASRRFALLTGLASALTLVGVVLAVARPAWLTGPLQELVQGGGIFAPLIYVVLCALAAPLHLGGVLVALSTTTWSLWQALALSFIGLTLGGAFTSVLLSRIGNAALRSRSVWPAWLRRAAESVERRRIVVGVAARLALGCGLALEAFFFVTGYKRGTYALVLLLGTALYVTQTVLGITVLQTLLRSAPGLAGVFALSLLVLLALAPLRRRPRPV
ncbi:hypothetical protein ACFFLM_02810 [Deinococcus oregonensis]|uniref:TVP38/TMEM64 family membrane protein n=1 Tax=Deinococcus oregonensis TaxID=1805970 RepID=A0ABV6ATT1_9DEIO